MSTYVKQQRALDPDLLLLNAGDDFIGTEWDRKASVDAAAAFMNLLRPDAMVRGLVLLGTRCQGRTHVSCTARREPHAVGCQRSTLLGCRVPM